MADLIPYENTIQLPIGMDFRERGLSYIELITLEQQKQTSIDEVVVDATHIGYWDYKD